MPPHIVFVDHLIADSTEPNRRRQRIHGIFASYVLDSRPTAVPSCGILIAYNAHVYNMPSLAQNMTISLCSAKLRFQSGCANIEGNKQRHWIRGLARKTFGHSPTKMSPHIILMPQFCLRTTDIRKPPPALDTLRDLMCLQHSLPFLSHINSNVPASVDTKSTYSEDRWTFHCQRKLRDIVRPCTRILLSDGTSLPLMTYETVW